MNEPICSNCGKPMRYNVPRLGADGGFVHADTSSPLCAEPRTIRDSIAEYRATRNLSSTKLLHKVLDKLFGLKCPHCGKDVSVTLP